MNITDTVASQSPLSLMTDYSSTAAGLKFGLFVKTQEIKQIDSSLRHILLLPKRDQRRWLEEHEEFVSDLLDNFVSDSTLALDGLQLDGEAMELSIEFVTVLRDVMNAIRSLFNDRNILKS